MHVFYFCVHLVCVSCHYDLKGSVSSVYNKFLLHDASMDLCYVVFSQLFDIVTTCEKPLQSCDGQETVCTNCVQVKNLNIHILT